MTCYKIKYSKDAEKFIKGNKQIGIRFMKAFADLAENPSVNSSFFDIKRVAGTKSNNIFRMRISKYRAVFKVDSQEILIFVFTIDSRGDVYKNI